MSTTIATSNKETLTKLFDRSKDKNYIDTIINFFDNAKRVDDEADEAKRQAEIAKMQADEAFKAAHNAMSLFVNELNYYRNKYGVSPTRRTDSSKGGTAPLAQAQSLPRYIMTWDRQWKNGAPVDERNEDFKRKAKRHVVSDGRFAPVYASGKPTIVGVRYIHK